MRRAAQCGRPPRPLAQDRISVAGALLCAREEPHTLNRGRQAFFFGVCPPHPPTMSGPAAGSNFVRGLKSLKVKEVGPYAGVYAKQNLAPRTVFSRLTNHVHKYKAHLDAGSAKPLFDTMALVFIGAYALAWPQVSALVCCLLERRRRNRRRGVGCAAAQWSARPCSFWRPRARPARQMTHLGHATVKEAGRSAPRWVGCLGKKMSAWPRAARVKSARRRRWGARARARARTPVALTHPLTLPPPTRLKT